MQHGEPVNSGREAIRTNLPTDSSLSPVTHFYPMTHRASNGNYSGLDKTQGVKNHHATRFAASNMTTTYLSILRSFLNKKQLFKTAANIQII